MTDAERKRAFAVVVAIVAAAVGALATFDRDGNPESEAPGHATATSSHGKPQLIVQSPAPGQEGMSTPSRAEKRRLQRAAHSAARRFTVAYLARDSGLDTPASRRALRATATAALWQSLREPIRIPPEGRPRRAHFERVNGISETASPGEIAATVAYRRDRRRLYIRLVLVNEAGAWRATRISP